MELHNATHGGHNHLMIRRAVQCKCRVQFFCVLNLVYPSPLPQAARLLSAFREFKRRETVGLASYYANKLAALEVRGAVAVRGACLFV